MSLLLIGLNHMTAPLEVRERFALSSEQGESMLGHLIPYLHNAVVLATCNRTEIYTNVQNTEVAVEHLYRFLGQWTGLTETQLASYLYTKTRWSTVRHLFRVTAGLDSMILGEEQILGQVRTAVKQAEQRQAIDRVLGAVFQHAQRAGRHVRVKTAISRNAVSVSSVAVKLAKETFGSLDALRVLVISAGEAGRLASRSLVSQGVRDIQVTNRNYQHAQHLAEQMGGQALPFTHLTDALACSDLVVSATGAPEHVITGPQLAEVMDRREGRQLLLVDIAVPRDIDPAAGDIPGVSLYNLDDVQAYAQRNLDLRSQEVAQAEIIIEGEVQKFQRWWRAQEVMPTITELLATAEDIRRSEMRKTLRHIPLSEEEQARIDAMSKAIVKKLLHAPLTYLKEQGSGADSAEALRAVFGLNGRTPELPRED